MAKTSLCRNPGRKASEPKNSSVSEIRFSAAKICHLNLFSLSFQICCLYDMRFSSSGHVRT